MTARNEKLNLIMNGLEESIQLAVEYDFPDKENMFEEYKQIAYKLCKCEAEANQSRQALEEAKKDDTVEAFKLSLEEKKKTITDKSIKQSSRYKAFETQLAYLTEHTEPSELLNETCVLDTEEFNLDQSVSHSTTNQMINDIDPITKQPLQKPCRNRICNHIYGMNTIIEILQVNPKLRCPIVGCGNKNLIKINQLIPDEELERKLHSQRNKKQSK